MTADRSHAGGPAARSRLAVAARRQGADGSRPSGRGFGRCGQRFIGWTGANSGEKAQIRPGAVHRDAAAGVRQHRHGLQRLGGGGARAVRPAVPLPDHGRRCGRCSAWRCWRSPCASTTAPTGTSRSSGALLGARRPDARRRAVQRAGQRRPGAGSASAASASSRRSWPRSPAILFTALILERRMHRIDECPYSLLPIAHRRRRAGRR